MREVTDPAGPQAVQIAEFIHNHLLPETIILFGSRARDDHRHTSDIDILVVVESTPPEETKAAAHAEAQTQAKTVYGTPTQVQLVWRTTEEFLNQRRNRNDLTARAMEEGVITGPGSEEFGSRFSEEYQYDHQHHWNVADQRIRNAENHLISFNSLADFNMPLTARELRRRLA